MKRIALILIFIIFINTIGAENEDLKVSDEVLEKIDDGEVEVVVILKESDSYGTLDDTSLNNIEKESEFSSISGFSAKIGYEELEQLMGNENVEKIYYKDDYKIFLDESVALINASIVQNLTYIREIRGKDQTICIIDTGINYSHSAFGGCSGDEFLVGNCSKVLSGYDFVNNDTDPMDDAGHGTHVAGIAAGNGDWNNDGIVDINDLAIFLSNWEG